MRKFVAGDRVVYRADGNLIGGILAEVFVSSLSGRHRARVVDSHAERKDPEAGRTVYLDDCRLDRDYYAIG